MCENGGGVGRGFGAICQTEQDLGPALVTTLPMFLGFLGVDSGLPSVLCACTRCARGQGITLLAQTLGWSRKP